MDIGSDISTEDQSTPADHFMTPQQARAKILSLGYKSWTQVPLGQSHFLDVLVTIACSKNERENLTKLLQLFSGQRLRKK